MARTPPANPFSVEAAGQLLDQLNSQVKRTRRSASVAAVHDLRVKIRRLTQALALFESFLPANKAKKLRRRLKRIMTLAGRVRDCDITIKLLSKSNLASVAALQLQCRDQRKDAAKTLVRSLGRWTEQDLGSKWRALIVAASRNAPLEENAGRALRSTARDFAARAAEAARAASPEELHRFRIATKKFRYTLELFPPGYGPHHGACLEQVKAIQGRLGRINDFETARRLLSGLKRGKKVAAQLKKKEKEGIADFLHHWTAEIARHWSQAALATLPAPSVPVG